MLNVVRCHRTIVQVCACAVVGALFLTGGLGCAKVISNAGGTGGGSGGSPVGLGGAGGRRTGGLGGTPATIDGSVDAPPPITDFPPEPIIGTATVPPNAPDLFGGTPRTGSAPCVSSPQDGTLMPKNWLRPRFDWKRAADENLFEIRLQVARFATPLRIYTTDQSYKLDASLWDDLRRSVNDEPITVSIRAMTVSGTGTAQQGPSAPAQVTFTIAPVEAPGKIVYWALAGDGSNGTGMLRGFGVGEEGVRSVLTPDQVVNRNVTTDGCIGCHTATPGGDGVQFVFGPPQSMIGSDPYFNNIADIQMGTEGTLPSYVTPDALAIIRTLRGIPAFSRSHWSDAERIVLLTDPNNRGDLISVKLNGTTPTDIQSLLARTGDLGGATEPTFSHDGQRIVYVSATPYTSIHDGRLDSGPADLYVVPYNDRAGGAATPLGGAAESEFAEYYPAFSPNDDLVAFSRIASPSLPAPPAHPTTYANSNSELFVVSTAGGTATRLLANDPPACLFQHSPGLTNDWSKWSPEARVGNGKTYNWLTFSSTRNGTPQLYITAIVTGGGAPLQTFPALYLWNQPATESNHTPSWDNFNIPPVVIIP
jgi:hypothetical protein